MYISGFEQGIQTIAQVQIVQMAVPDEFNVINLKHNEHGRNISEMPLGVDSQPVKNSFQITNFCY